VTSVGQLSRCVSGQKAKNSELVKSVHLTPHQADLNERCRHFADRPEADKYLSFPGAVLGLAGRKSRARPSMLTPISPNELSAAGLRR
jgi:hypothetical protein